MESTLSETNQRLTELDVEVASLKTHVKALHETLVEVLHVVRGVACRQEEVHEILHEMASSQRTAKGSSEEHGAARPAAPSTEAARTQPRAGLFVPAGGDRDLDDSAPSRSCDPRELVIRLRLPGGPCGVRDERPAPGPAGTDAELGDAPIGTPMETDPAPVATVDRRRLGDVPPSCDTLVVRTRDGSVSGAGEGASTGGERVAGAGDARSGRVGGEPDLTAEEWQELYDMAGGTDWTTDVSPEEWKEMREAYDT